MTEQEYKKRLLKRVIEYLKDNFIELRIGNEENGILFLYLADQKKNSKATMIYDVFEAKLTNNITGEEIDPCIKEKVIEYINIYENGL